MLEAWARICAALRKERCLEGFGPACHHLLHWLHRHEHLAHDHLHTVYFGLVFIESHGYYGYAAGALFVLSIVQAVSPGEAS